MNDYNFLNSAFTYRVSISQSVYETDTLIIEGVNHADSFWSTDNRARNARKTVANLVTIIDDDYHRYEVLWTNSVMSELDALAESSDLKIVASQTSPMDMARNAVKYADAMVRQVTETVTRTMPLGRMPLSRRDEAFELIYKTASYIGATNIEARTTGYVDSTDVNVYVALRSVAQIVWGALGDLSPTEKQDILDGNFISGL